MKIVESTKREKLGKKPVSLKQLKARLKLHEPIRTAFIETTFIGVINYIN